MAGRGRRRRSNGSKPEVGGKTGATGFQLSRLKRRVLPPNHPFLAVALQNMADFYEKDGRKGEALKIREESLVLSRRLKGAEHRDTLRVW
jgi:hypothetical protein